MSKIVPVILSGGGGTRLWPLSTPERPKQFLALTGPETMFQQTLLRVTDDTRFDAPVVVANARHADMVSAQMADIGATPRTIILEPAARNTAPAIALAALAVEADAPILVMPSDHVILDVSAFHAAIEAAMPVVEQGWLITFGITPTAPETGYGYIQLGDKIAPGVQKVARFVEKPDVARAQAMIESGDHAWNGGIFLFRAGAYLDALRNFEPDMHRAASEALAKGRVDGAFTHPDAEAFAAAPSNSIDYAVMERADRVAVVPVSMGWSDVGSWDALYEIGVGASEVPPLEIDVTSSFIRSDGARIHAVGVSDLIVVAAGKDILILPRGRSQEVRKIVEALAAKQAG